MVLNTRRIRAANEGVWRCGVFDPGRAVYHALLWIFLRRLCLDLEAQVALSPFALLFRFLPTMDLVWIARQYHDRGQSYLFIAFSASAAASLA